MPDKLDKIFDRQGLFADIVDPGDADLEQLTKDYALHIMSEAHEVLQKVPWKKHRGTTGVAVVRENVIEEIVDVTKLAFGLLCRWGVTPSEFYAEFMRKSDVVEQRYRQEHLQFNDHEKVCAIDIDDVITDHCRYWLDYIELRIGIRYRSVMMAKQELTVSSYEELKDELRRSEYLLKLIPIPGSAKFLDELKKMKYKIVLISARPYKKYLRTFADTMSWLKNNAMIYDALFFDSVKHLRILETCPNLEFMVEDDPSYAASVRNLGCRVYLRRSECTSNLVADGITLYDQFSEILTSLRESL